MTWASVTIIAIGAMVTMIVWVLMDIRSTNKRFAATGTHFEALTGRKLEPELATDQFEAWTHCPSCGEFDCHAMREPFPWDPADWRTWSQGRAEYLELHQSATTIEVWGRHAYRWIDSTPEYPIAEPVNETRFATIRICKCGKEWGQK